MNQSVLLLRLADSDGTDILTPVFSARWAARFVARSVRAGKKTGNLFNPAPLGAVQPLFILSVAPAGAYNL